MLLSFSLRNIDLCARILLDDDVDDGNSMRWREWHDFMKRFFVLSCDKGDELFEILL